MESGTRPAIEARGVARRYGKAAEVLRGLDLEVPAGSVYGLLGRNGAGKTTLVQILLGVLRRDAGEARVLGLDPATDGPALRARVGYVPERPTYYGHARIREIVAFVRPFYPTWSAAEEERLRDWLRLPYEKRVRELSKGGLAKLALLLALAHEPEVLLLDEPTGGLDAIVREEFLEAVVDLVARRERTVLFSSHQLEDLERVVDRVGILAGARLRAAGSLEELRARVKEVRVHFGDAPAAPRFDGLPGVLDAGASAREAILMVEAPNGRFEEALRERCGGVPLEIETATTSLAQLFRAYAGCEEV